MNINHKNIHYAVHILNNNHCNDVVFRVKNLITQEYTVKSISCVNVVRSHCGTIPQEEAESIAKTIIDDLNTIWTR